MMTIDDLDFDEGFLNREEMAERVSVCTTTLKRWSAQGLPTYYSRGGTRSWYKLEDVQNFLRKKNEKIWRVLG